MVHKEESIVNIAKGAAEHLKNGRIERDEIFSDISSSEHVTVVARSEYRPSFDLLIGSFDKCKRFCESHYWFYVDGDNFYWDLDLKDDREPDFPKDFYEAVLSYSLEEEKDVDSEFVRQNADKLVASRFVGLNFSSFEAWVNLENILGEKLTEDQFSFLEQKFSTFQIEPSHISLTDKMKSSLEEYLENTADKEKTHGIDG